ncbi:MAG: hypothetical protein M0Q92_03840 [Methanoregula sp.]|jgi:hypothetical protein|nr:hypothetical protein [Methanoregula sp.]
MRSRFLHLALLVLLTFAMVATIPAFATKTAEQSVDDTLTRGSRFTVTITGLPNTSYYVWLPRTFTMTGEPYDQPPVIADNTENVRKDPTGGPYTIGSYQYNNGNGRTILDDVAPPTASMSNTNYYALATTNTAGQAIVDFQTSLDTGLRSYSVKVENTDSVDSDNLQVGISVHSRKAPSMVVYTQEQTRQPTVITQVVTIIVTATPPPTALENVPLQTRTDTPAPLPTTKAAGGLMPVTCAVLAAAFCIRARQ